MTLSFQAVRDADLKPLAEAVARWRLLPGQFETIADTFQNDVTKGLNGSDWEGNAAEAAVRKCEAVGKQLRSASEQAQDMYHLLDSTHQAFSSAQKRLRDILAQVAENNRLTISADGVVSLDPTKNTGPHAAALTKSYQDVVQGYNDGIQRVLADATEADTALNWALTQDHNGRKRGFDPDMYRSIAQVERDRQQAAKDAKTASRIAAMGLDASYDQIVQLNSILTRREGDPYFSERFATTLGANRTLDFWAKAADGEYLSPAWRTTLQGVQKSLGNTLATATHSNSAGMRQWRKDVIALGDRVYFPKSASRDALQVSGYQIMSSLLRNGHYETEFLKDYGRALIDYEKKQDENPAYLWVRDPLAHLNLNGSDWGNDPMTGYMKALSHDPEAAKSLFYSKEWADPNNKQDPLKQIDSDLEYLLNEREWPNDPTTEKNPDFSSGYDELGHALEAATLGRSYDQPDLSLSRDSRGANVMEQVVTITQDDPKFFSERSGITNSIARMGAGYIDDLNWSVSNFGESRSDADLRDRAFAHSSESSGHINISPETASRFLVRLGAEESGYQILTSAQLEYSLERIKTNPDPDAATALSLQTGSKVHGILDESLLKSIDLKYTDMAEEADKKLADAAEWKKSCFSQGLGLTAGVVTLPFGGPTTSAGVAFAVPAIVDGITGAIDTEFGMAVDKQLEENAADFTRKEEIDRDRFTQIGKSSAIAPYDAYVMVRGMNDEEKLAWLTNVDIEGAYDVGTGEARGADAR